MIKNAAQRTFQFRNYKGINKPVNTARLLLKPAVQR